MSCHTSHACRYKVFLHHRHTYLASFPLSSLIWIALQNLALRRLAEKVCVRLTDDIPSYAYSHSPPPTAYKSKGALKQDDLRRRREEQQVEIRRQKREENISKRRNFLPSSGADSDEEVGGGNWDPPVCQHIYRVQNAPGPHSFAL